MVTGDHPVVADTVAAALGVDGVLAERSPADKVDAVTAERADAVGATVMVGDGINDAPALAAADVGVAMGARGATASSEAADVVILVDRLDRLAEAIVIAKRSRAGSPSRACVLGMGLSIVAMIVAAFGFLPPVAGALLQEAIDVLVILNALRALSGGTRADAVRIAGWSETSEHLRAEHRELRPAHRRASAAWPIDSTTLGPAELARRAPGGSDVPRRPAHAPRGARGPHGVPDALEGDRRRRPDRGAQPDPSRDLPPRPALSAPGGRPARRTVPGAEELRDLRRVLYSLYAILDLHMAQEEELYLSLGDEHPPGEPSVAPVNERPRAA